MSTTRTRLSTAGTRCVLGLMSGTSADGIDAVAVRIAGRGERMRAEFLLRHHLAYPLGIRRRLLAVMAPAATRTEELCSLHAELGDLFGAAACALMRKLGRRRPALIGLAGQTVCHLPGSQGKTTTLQLGDAARVAERTGITVVADFRQSDVAAGGQGAPLVPWTDWVLFRHPTRARAVQNIGGIGNVTWIPPAAAADEVIAFDTGPGNMIIDGLMWRITAGRLRYDRDGRRAAGGRVLQRVLDRWLAHPYFQRRLPKTTGREEFGDSFIRAELPRLRRTSNDPNDWLATATAFTAQSILASYRRYISYFNRSPRSPALRPAGVDLILCGGGARNRTLAGLLCKGLQDVTVEQIDAFGIPSEAKEGMSFALLAAACMDGAPANLPQVTGARGPTVLGRIIPATSDQ